MKIKIVRIENRVVTCELEDGTRIDIAKQWFTTDIHEDDKIEIDVVEMKKS